MNRRGFLKGLVGGLAVATAARTFPFRVYSFPSEIVIPKPNEYLTVDMLRNAVKQLQSKSEGWPPYQILDPHMFKTFWPKSYDELYKRPSRTITLTEMEALDGYTVLPQKY